MSAPGNSILIIALVALFVAVSGYAAGRIHQRRHAGEDREAAYRDGYEKGSHSVFSLAARVIVPRRPVRAAAPVKPESEARDETTVLPPMASARAGSGKPAQLGFPVPPPPPAGTLPEPPAVGGVRFQRFPDPRTGRETTVLPDMSKVAAARRGVRAVDPGAESADHVADSPQASAHPPVETGLPPVATGVPPVLPGVPPVATGLPPVLTDLPPVATGLSGDEAPGPAGEAEQSPAETEPPAPGVPAAAARPAADSPVAAGRSLLGRPFLEAGGVPEPRRAPGHRAPDDDEETLDSSVELSSTGRHTVPDELVQAATYRLPADRVFRAKVPDATPLPEEPTTKLVPRPRES